MPILVECIINQFVNMKIYIYYVYILSNKFNNVLYTGVSNNLSRRVYEHKHKINKGFTSKYNVNKLVYYEIFDFIELAIKREKQIKGYSKAKKQKLIISKNPEWIDLYENEAIRKI